MSKLLSLSFILFSTFYVSAQQNPVLKNTREGEAVEYCHQHVKLEEMRLKNPADYQKYIEGQAQLEIETKNYVGTKSNTIYTIPVVFHVLHEGGSENISNEQIYDAIEVINRDFRLLNSDASTVHTDFQGMPTDVEIEFKLATIAPDGTCFNGITRTYSSKTNDGEDGAGQLAAAFAGNDVYQGTWSHENYLNVIVARNIGGAAGYTYRPSTWSNSSIQRNSIWMLHSYTGSIGTASVNTSRTFTHEVGHWLNLMHTWGGTNDPGLMSNCDTDDDVADTPNTIGATTCNLNENSCGPRANVENYMDYSYCSKMFTPGQVARMRAAVVSSTGKRNNLWTEANLIAVGAIDNPPLCKADFSANKQVICSGETITFNDQSFNSVTDWSWSFPGGDPATSTLNNPSVMYSVPGTYEVSLIASNSTDSEIETKTTFITVLNTISTLPFYEGFESYNTLADAQGLWFVQNQGNNNQFEITNTVGHTGLKSVKLENFGQTGNNIDELISSSLDLSQDTLGNVTFSFRYAYKKRENANNDLLRVYFSSNCGTDWQQRAIRSATQMTSGSANPIVATNWTPTPEDWKTVHIPFSSQVYETYLTDGFRYKFRFEGRGGNNIYIDDINLYNGEPSDDIIVGIQNSENTMKDILLFPNPNDGELTISFSLENAQQVTFKIMDISGKELKLTILQGNIGENVLLMDNSDFASGMYFVQLNTLSSSTILPFIKK
jgi:PKD repeat protein